MNNRAAPGIVRDSILATSRRRTARPSWKSAKRFRRELARSRLFGAFVSESQHTELFERTARGHYKLRVRQDEPVEFRASTVRIGRATLVHSNCFDWMRSCEPHSIHAVVTDPPYGLLEYTDKEQTKLRKGRGGVWRIPPSFDGHQRAPLPRFTVLNDGDRATMYDFFFEFGQLALRVTAPGANVLVASNPLLVHVVANAMSSAGLEIRGYIARLVMTMRVATDQRMPIGVSRRERDATLHVRALACSAAPT